MNIVVVNLVLAGDGQEDNTWTHNPVLTTTEKKDRTDKSKTRVKIDRSTSHVSARALSITDESPLQSTVTNASQKSHSESLKVSASTSVYVNDDHIKSNKDSLHDLFSPPSRKNSPRFATTIADGDPKQSSSKTEKSTDPRPVRWLTDPDMLCKAIPESRVFQFGYRPLQNEKLSAHFYDEVAKALLEKLPTVELKHPIIFISCRDGGFVVEKALILAASAEDQTLYRMTSGVLFLGTPFEYSQSFRKLFPST